MHPTNTMLVYNMYIYICIYIYVIYNCLLTVTGTVIGQTQSRLIDQKAQRSASASNIFRAAFPKLG